MKHLPLILLSAVLIASCNSDTVDPGSGNTLDQGTYNVIVTGDRIGNYQNGRVTLWNPGSIGDIVVLGPEQVGQGIDQNDPIATLTIQFLNNGTNGNQQDIQKISLHTKEVTIGSAEEQDERLFEYEDVDCTSGSVTGLHILETGDNYIKGRFCFQMERRAIGNNNMPETITMSGEFTAIKPY